MKSNVDTPGVRNTRRPSRWVIVARCAMIALGLPLAVAILYGAGFALVQALALYNVELESPWLALGIGAWHALFAATLTVCARAIRFK
jgi:hypothetical protein